MNKASVTFESKTKNSRPQGSGSSQKSLEQLLQLQIIESKKLNDQEIELMRQQKELLKSQINKFKA